MNAVTQMPPQGKKATGRQQVANQLAAELWSCAGQLQGAGRQLEQLHGLFEAIRKLGTADPHQLASMGADLTLDWADLLATGADRAFALSGSTNAATSVPQAADTPPPAGEPGAGLTLAAYDTATLHLEKAITQVEMLCALGSTGIQQLTPAAIAGAFSGLLGELTTISEALAHGRSRGAA